MGIPSLTVPQSASNSITHHHTGIAPQTSQKMRKGENDFSSVPHHNFPNISVGNILGSQPVHRSGNRGGSNLPAKQHMYNYSEGKKQQRMQHHLVPNNQYFHQLIHPQHIHQQQVRAGSYGGQGVGPLESTPGLHNTRRDNSLMDSADFDDGMLRNSLQHP